MKNTLKILSTIALITLMSCDTGEVDDFGIEPNYPTDGLVAYFPFNRSWEDVINAETVVIPSVNQPSFGEDQDGNSGASIYFDGNDQYLVIELVSEIVSSPAHQATIAMWIRNDITADLRRTLLAERTLSTMAFTTDSEQPSNVSSNYNYLVEDNPDGVSAIGNSIVAGNEVGVWTHVAITVDDEFYRFYVNGNLIDENILGQLGDEQYIPIFQAYTDFVLGANYQEDEFWRGNVDELFFYDRSLDEGEIEKLYLR